MTLKRRVTVLGATGSVGTCTLKLVADTRRTAAAEIEVEALTAHTNAEALAALAIEHQASFAAVADPGAGGRLAAALKGTGIAHGAGPEAVIEAAERDADWVMAAIVGAAGIKPLLAAAHRGADIAFANKECLVCAGEAVLAAVAEGGGRLLPVDSEHNAIFQVFDFARPETVRRIVLTASGGPFRERPRDTFDQVTAAEAVSHPNWSMGAKISVDSATMMNKGLERIEAAYLFPVPKERIEILVHPQSVIHSMVDYIDGSMLAQLGTPDMTIPIASALAWPERIPTGATPLDLAAVGRMTFEPPDEQRFPALRQARESLEAGGLMTAVLNAANEVAVAAFLKGQVRFTDIAALTDHCLQTVQPEGDPFTLEGVLEADRAARAAVKARALSL
ncbi:1-deoxy-D-xylulose 5-phosphate reductoisomerase [Parvularcula bermudensis HTCC2503]|uniref:1-deoxy-D-xylulose 5-phosphate reductoisomerase n=1 Tax=Parvularcula bermudensis (strain ATCC BAA-594 / HTCC2503 / KCTC 12087) TaxID=314260 RepID=E0TCD5_PARBH|nr:1-deoxy-D-xylulose-5-phosphate reductoisomerase [Parvularcula bermudensis]ADM08568.1 1-deoxy-D-xylulose 5-phosphate reductoisomerase [Parvularcula bermudensis HTCC2503]